MRADAGGGFGEEVAFRKGGVVVTVGGEIFIKYAGFSVRREWSRFCGTRMKKGETLKARDLSEGIVGKVHSWALRCRAGCLKGANRQGGANQGSDGKCGRRFQGEERCCREEPRL